jgi:oxygen-independent coproporphyrinogen-3 oxidase
MLGRAGYHHYEISNFAQPGYEAVHNSAYWKHVPYVGLGPGAHSFSGTSRSWNQPDLKAYAAAPLSLRDGEELDEEQLDMESIMLALRTSEGISGTYLREHCDRPALERAFSCGDLQTLPSGKVRIPEERFFISDAIISEII